MKIVLHSTSVDTGLNGDLSGKPEGTIPLKRIQSVPDQRVFYLALPGEGTVRIQSTTIRSHLLGKEGYPVLAGYRRSTDSSAIESVYEAAVPDAGMVPAQPISVKDYEWFRGLRLAKLLISPVYGTVNGLQAVEEMEVIIRFTPGDSLSPMIQNLSGSEFDPVEHSLILNSEQLPSLARSAMTWHDTTGSWFVSGRSYLRLCVAQDGIYRILPADLTAKGIVVSQIHPGKFQLFRDGREIPLYVQGEEDGVFAADDYIEFPGLMNYGDANLRRLPLPEEPNPMSMNRYTDTSTYWLTWGGERGRRISSNAGVISVSDTLTWYTQTVHLEKDVMIQMIGGDLALHQDPRWLSGDMWGWGWLGAGGTYNATFTASNIYSGFPTANIVARFASWGAENVRPSHKVRLRINNSDTLKALDLSQYEHGLIEGTAPITQLVNGTNTIRLHSLRTSSSVNWILFDWAEADYPRQLVAINDTLLFTFRNLPAAVRTIRLAGLKTKEVLLYKIAPALKRISSITILGTTAFTVTFSDTIRSDDTYLLIPVSKTNSPLMKEEKRFVQLRDANRGADYLLITPNRFSSLAQSYSSFIASRYGFRTAVVNVQDIFDEFGFGNPSPESIREFLRATTRWRAPMPSYLLIVGDATYDYKYLNADPNPLNRPVNSVPSFGLPVSDPMLAVLDDTSVLPQMYVGRLTVNSVDEFTRYFEHVQSYITAPFDDWNKRYIFFAGGDPNTPGQVESFRAVNERIITTLIQPAPIGGIAANFYKTASPKSDFGPYSAQFIREAIDHGGIFLNYIGHSGTQTWDNSIGEPAQLQSARNRFSLIADFGCSTARFAEPDIKSFGELFTVGPTSSAIGYIGNSATGFTSHALSLPPLYYKQFLSNAIYEIGKAHLMSKIERLMESGGPSSAANRAMMLTNTLLGDPVVRVPIPQQPNLAVRVSDLQYTPKIPTDEDGQLHLRIPYANLGKVTADSFSVRIRGTGGAAATDTTIQRRLPLFYDTLSVTHRINEAAGEHLFSIDLNPLRTIPELNYDDNKLSQRIPVLSTAFRIVYPAPHTEQPVSELVFLNPMRTQGSGLRSVMLDLDTLPSLQTARRYSTVPGKLLTRFPISGLRSDQHYYWRVAGEQSANSASTGKFFNASDSIAHWVQRDSSDWMENLYDRLVYTPQGVVKIADRSVAIRVTSSGFADGTFGTVELNGHNVLPNTFGRGHSIVVLDSLDLSVKTVRVFDPFGSAAQSESLRVFLQNLPCGELVVQTVIDEGANNLSQAARSAIKSIGSRLIDSLQYRDSWAIIGRKGALPGTVPEQWKKVFTGRVVLDTTFIRTLQRGVLTSPEIGPAGKWIDVKLRTSRKTGSAISLDVLGLRQDGLVDTVIMNYHGELLPLSSISALRYPSLKLQATLAANSFGESSLLTSWSVALEPPAELALNDQVVSLTEDTVLEGEPVTIQSEIHNVGSQDADSVKVLLTALVEGRGVLPLDSLLIPSLPARSSYVYTSAITTTGRCGNHTLFITIDPDQRIPELYRGNNTYSLPFIVATDTVRPSFDISFDGQQIRDGDYISARPEIRINIYDNSPLQISDPRSVHLQIDDHPVQLGAAPDSSFEIGSGEIKATVTYRPQLRSGDHVLSLQVKDATGNDADTSLYRIAFRVSETVQLLDVFNYPNPFGQETYITFNLTGSSLPDEFRLKIYSVAGRVIQEIIVSPSSLRFGFNRIHWDGRDRDGNEAANGAYLYKIVARFGEQTIEEIGKMVRMR